MATHLGVKQVGLRWEPDEREDSSQVIAFVIYRRDGSFLTKLTPKPYIIGLMEDNQVKLLDRIVYFTDDRVPLKEVEYLIYGLDAFGRKSRPDSRQIKG